MRGVLFCVGFFWTTGCDLSTFLHLYPSTKWGRRINIDIFSSTREPFAFKHISLCVFWAEFVFTAIHINKCLSTLLLSWQTPLEQLYSKIIICSHLKVIECHAYATNVYISLKLASRAKYYVFLVNPIGQKLTNYMTLQCIKSSLVVMLFVMKNIFPCESTPSDPYISHNLAPVVLVVVSDFSTSEPLSTGSQTPPP